MATKSSAKNGVHKAANRIAGVPAGEPADAGIVIPKLQILRLQLKVRGITPLIMCRFDEKVKREMEERTEGKAKNKKAPKDPEAEWNAARWVSTEGRDGIHAGGIRASLIDAVRSVDGLTMTAVKQAIFIRADGRSADGTPLVRIHGKAERFSNMCRTTTGVA